ncbi:DAK2 domain-containing protein [Moorella sulfitireducens]|uniref:DAK2 domain-containing protein n=1 Tax=Neomoorella sulfitireducens TaxID=2972948 RepID=UPI0021AC7F86|nr:DAK2 domain-containing protein [Moorella sulfitireducens]
MNYYFFDGRDFKDMLVGAVNQLAAARAEIDALNVYPVPDGDTGTNMYLTLLNGVKEIQGLNNPALGIAAGAAARGCLLGARGNSGVILSQIIRGFADALAGKERAGAGELARAFARGTDYAYRAVTEPVEGTILTVCRAIGQAVAEAAAKTRDLPRVIVYACRQAQQALERTPDLLPVLKEAGVVDAGGKGLVVILEGIIQSLKDLALKKDIQLFDLAVSQQKQFAPLRTATLPAQIEFTYCTEFVLAGTNIPLQTLKSELAPYGDCLLIVGDQKTAKVHIHSNHPGLVLECGLKYGALHSVEINNMEQQHLEWKSARSKEKPEIGVVAVGPGEGLNAIMESLGAIKIVEGGQTMNPSAQDLAAAIEDTSAGQVIILPNNGNILMAAEQAARIAPVTTRVVPAVTIPQGIAALMAFNPFAGLEENVAKMTEAITRVKTGEITRAARNSRVNGREILAGEYIGLVEGKVVACGTGLAEVMQEVLARMIDDSSGLVSLYFGNGLSTAEAEGFAGIMRRHFPGVDFELYYGGQPLYQFIISVE